MKSLKGLAAAAAGALSTISVSAMTVGAVTVSTGIATYAHADSKEKLGATLTGLEAEVADLQSSVRGAGAATPLSMGDEETADGKLIDARVAIDMRNYEAAAVILYEYVEKNRSSFFWDEALYYLGEALFQKGDYVPARTHFRRLVEEVGPSSTYYQQSLERLIELTLKLDDATDIERWLSALDALPASELRATVPYVRGKYAYYSGNFPEARSLFSRIPKGSDYYFQAQYFTGVSLIAEGKLREAIDAYRALIAQPAKTRTQRRVAELSHLALARLYYETGKLSSSIDEYLTISHRSDLFDEALYEIAWVYVKDKKFEKALETLELLALTDPTAERMPELRLLEGNLRVRLGQESATEGRGDGQAHYDKALKVFRTLHDRFARPKSELDRLIAEKGDPRVFIAQITGRESKLFEVGPQLPEVAASWLRLEPEVERVVAIETDLGEVSTDIKEAEAFIYRLESALSSSSSAYLFPALASKRIRAIEIGDLLATIREEVVSKERELVMRYASPSQKSELARLEASRASIARELASLPNSNLQESERIGSAQGKVNALDQRAAEVASIVSSTETELAALEKYAADIGAQASAETSGSIPQTMAELRRDLDSLKSELEEIEAETTLVRDQAGIGGASAHRRDILRAEMRTALDDEHRLMKPIFAAMSGSDRRRADELSALFEKSNTVLTNLDQVVARLGSIVDGAVVEIQATLAAEKASLAAYKQEFNAYEMESAELGGEAVSGGLASVADKFYEILIKSDDGIVDVAWSLKEAADQLAKRLTLDQARERRTLDAEFGEAIRDIRKEREEAQKQSPRGSASAAGEQL